MTTVFFVRHGVTAHTGHRLSGWMEGVSLTPEGKEQADHVAERLTKVKLRAVYSSPIDRTMETAAPIARRHRLEVIERPALGEVEFGKWTNRTFGTLKRTKLWSKVQRWPSGTRFPDGESFREVQTRALDETDRIRGEHPGGAVCCVSHADVIKLVMAHFLGMHIDLFQRLAIAPASISVLHLGEDGPMVLALNTT
jgi:probable phosphomutase (TIGR03848 family)